MVRSENMSSRPLSSNILKNSGVNVTKKGKISTQINKSAEEDYITSLQKQVYYLELEMKLMKDRELDTKNKIGGYEVLFRDGVPLNENFLALKTKYKNERENFEKIILDLNNTIDQTTKENEDLKNQIEQTNNNYFNLIEQMNQEETNLGNNIFDSNQKLYTTTNYITHLNDDKEILDQDLTRFESENLQNNRIIEKNTLFHEDPTEKNVKKKKESDEKFKNAAKINKRFLLEEEKERDKHIDENNKLNDELDECSKLDDEKLKEKIKEYECRQSIILKNQVKNSELKMELLLSKFKDKEAIARDLLDEKNKLAQQIAEIEETNKMNFDGK